ncbi:hypothetical protein GOC74_17240 [Halomicrobium mukohataei]|uniref:Uncharacterized protein n=1 Tax=Halomicrobium mukohataei TaxID=57705 RepID=A0A847UHE1_9EURY|nr:hypothetical protein [Halomicrobium mukohataei]NLV11667.1 hypothetical protein [Halomicrobium mukohataei]
MGTIKDKREELTYPAHQVLQKDLVELANYSAQRRRDLYNQLEQNKEEYEWDFYPEHRESIPEATKENELASFEAAKLLLATAIEEAAEADPESKGFVDQFEAGEREFVRQFDDFRRKFKQIDEENLETNIKNKDGKVHEFVTEELEAQADLRESLLDTSSNEIRGATISYFQQEFEEFFELADEAVFLYIKHHGLPNTIEGIVSAAKAARDAKSEREAVEATVRDELESLSETIHHSLRDQERALRSEMSRLQSEMATGGVDADAVEGELDEIKDQIATLSEQRSADRREISEKLDTISTLEDDLEAQIDQLEAAREETRQELQDEAASKAASLLEDELERLSERKGDLSAEIQRLRNERERLETTGDRLDQEFGDLEERVATAEQRVDQVDELDDRVSEIAESVRSQHEEPDGKAIRAEVARLYEMDYVTRFETSVEEATHLTLPGGERFEIPEGFWEDRRRHFTGDHRSIVADVLDDETTVDRYPVGRFSTYRVRTNKFVAFSETKLVVEAVVAANLEAFAANGFDARPAGLDDLIDVVNETVARAESNDTTHLIGIASPTGWTDDVEAFVQNEDAARSRFDQQVSVCLVDIQSNELLYDRNDRLVSENVDLFTRAVDSERVADCIEVLRNDYVDDPMTEVVQHHAVVDEHDFGPHIVRAAFERLADDGYGETGYPNTADGLCFVVS